jgi:serine/threonine protein kinase
MRITPGERIGPYEVVALIGAGGMGEVYRARDTKLKREVALKVLPEAFAGDPERMARFQAPAALSFIHFRESPPPERTLRHTMAVPENSTVHSFAISPDGRQLAIAAAVRGKRQLWLRPLDALQEQPKPSFEPGAPLPLFDAHMVAGGFSTFFQYDVTADGKRFLVDTTAASSAPPLTVVVNWTAGLKK